METTTYPGVPSRPATTTWPRASRNPFVFWDLLSFVLRDYFRSPWIFLNLLVLVGVQALFYNYDSTQSHLFGVQYATTALLAAITTAVLFARANRAESYPILARRVSRISYAGAILLAAWIIAMLGHILSVLVEYLRFSGLLQPGYQTMPWRTLPVYLTGSVPIMVAAAFAVCLIALLTHFIAPSGVRLAVLAILALLVMSFDSANFPVESLRPILQAVPPVLAPLAGALKFATTSPPDSVAIVSLLLLAVYTIVLLGIVLGLATERELILD